MVKVEDDIMFEGCLAKFTQNSHLKQYLIDTGEKLLADSCKNVIWGTGVTINHPKHCCTWCTW